MFIGLTFNLRNPSPVDRAEPSTSSAELPSDDAEEEFDSPETIQALADVLRGMGHEVALLGDGEPLLRKLLDGPRPDVVFNFAEGTGIGRSREARVPCVLELLGIPYTGSDPLTLAVTLDKDCAKRLVQAAGWPTAQWKLIDVDAASPENRAATARELAALPLPAIIKPALEGSSKGIFAANLIQDRARLIDAVSELLDRYRQPVLVEEFIDGDELTVGLIGNPPEVLGVMRVVPRDARGPFVYSLEVKRDWRRQVIYECPAPLSPRDDRAVREAAIGAWQALGCRDFARVDFRLRDGVPYFLEVNPLPGLNPQSSDLVLMAAPLGISYPELIRRIMDAALARLNKSGDRVYA